MLLILCAAEHKCAMRDCQMCLEGFWHKIKIAWFRINAMTFSIYNVLFTPLPVSSALLLCCLQGPSEYILTPTSGLKLFEEKHNTMKIWNMKKKKILTVFRALINFSRKEKLQAKLKAPLANYKPHSISTVLRFQLTYMND